MRRRHGLEFLNIDCIERYIRLKACIQCKAMMVSRTALLKVCLLCKAKHACACTYIYIYIYITCVYIYIYIYIHSFCAHVLRIM